MKTFLCANAYNKSADQLAYPRSLNSAIVVRTLYIIISPVAKSKIEKVWLVYVAEQAWSEPPKTNLLATGLELLNNIGHM